MSTHQHRTVMTIPGRSSTKPFLGAIVTLLPNRPDLRFGPPIFSAAAAGYHSEFGRHVGQWAGHFCRSSPWIQIPHLSRCTKIISPFDLFGRGYSDPLGP